jgi:polar amino acid transport system substrate-binding protein
LRKIIEESGMKKIKLIMVVMVLSVVPGWVMGADSNLLVKYKYHGKTLSFQGEKVKDLTYVWNKGASKKVAITTLDWMPYIGESICKQGWVQQVTVALLTSQGYEVTSTFYPWARTISEAERGKVDILYPEWYIESTAPSDVTKGKKRWDNLAVSQRIPGGPLAFLKAKGNKVSFDGDFTKLKGESIGVVRGYQHTPEFDALMDKKFFKIDQAKDDYQQALKLVNKRTNMIINDPNVVRFTLLNSSLSQADKDKYLGMIEDVKPAIQYNYLYYAIAKNKKGWESLLDVVNTTIHEFESKGILFDIINDTLKTCKMNMDSTFEPYSRANPSR